MKNRNEELDILKGLLIVIVVLRHVFQVVALDTDVDYLSNLMTAVEMPLFILISGYFGSKSLLVNNSSIVSVLTKKTKTYLIPFASFYIFFRIIPFITENIGDKINLLINNITLSLWFLFVIWVLSIVLNIAVFIGSNTKISLKKKCIVTFCVSYFILGLFGSLGLFFGFDFLGIKYILYYSVFYFLGYYIHYVIDVKFLLQNDWFSMICTFIYFIGCYYYKILLMPDDLINIFIRVILAIAGSTVLYRVVYFANKQLKTFKLDVIGAYTLEIYYIHSFLVRTIEIIPENNLMSYMAIIKSCVFVAFLIIAIVSIIIVIKNNRILSFIVFGKKYE